MAEMCRIHVVEIPPVNDAQHQIACLKHHPLKEISESPGHLLLLKLWQREEEVISQRISAFEERVYGIKGESFRLCFLYFAFHFLFLVLLFTSNVEDREACGDWWVPASLSAVTSLVVVCSVQARISGYWKVWRELQSMRGDGRALTRCVQELRMKGSSFDLSKEPSAAKRMKSSSVEVRWRPMVWCSRNALAIGLSCFAGLVFPACKYVVCG